MAGQQAAEQKERATLVIKIALTHHSQQGIDNAEWEQRLDIEATRTMLVGLVPFIRTRIRSVLISRGILTPDPEDQRRRR